MCKHEQSVSESSSLFRLEKHHIKAVRATCHDRQERRKKVVTFQSFSKESKTRDKMKFALVMFSNVGENWWYFTQFYAHLTARLKLIACRRKWNNRIMTSFNSLHIACVSTERDQHVRLRDTEENRMQTFMEMLCGASRLLSLNSCVTWASSGGRRHRFLLAGLPLSLQVR